MTALIIYTRADDGGMTIVYPAISCDDPEGFKYEDALKRALEKDIPADATDTAVIEEKELPQSTRFRNAWDHDGRDVFVNMDKARELLKEQLRIVRLPMLLALDVAYMRADERGDAAAKRQIAERKQAWRDVTDDPAIAAATTPDALAAIWPADAPPYSERGY
jgi:hypothetical protein